MFSFQQKIFIIYVGVFLLFLALIFPFSSTIVRSVVIKTLEGQAEEMISEIKTASNDDALIRRLQEMRSTTFFRATVITNEKIVIYDSHPQRLLGPKFSREYIVDNPEILEAFKEGTGYYEDYSELLNQKFTYLAKAFDFHGKTYVLRTAFPYKYVADLTRNCEIGFLILSIPLLLLFSLMTWFVIYLSISPLQKIINAVKFYQDGTQNTIPEIELKATGPFHELNQLAITLNSLTKKIQDHISHLNKLVEMRKDFVANASHELKTPITIIRGFAETLHDHPDLPKETLSSITDKIVKNCKRMTALIKDLLTLSDVENIPESRLEECDLFNLAGVCKEKIQAVYPEAEIVLRKPENEEIFIIADPNLIELAFTNLIENAAKYSPRPAKIRIEFEKTKNQIKIKISDQGIGIPQGDLEHIFERFYTVDKAHSQKMGGSGLGLSIVQTIISKHLGDISVSSELNKGTTFIITLPYS